MTISEPRYLIPLEGVRVLDNRLTAVDVWQMLHSNAREWTCVPRDANFFRVREMLDEADWEALKALRQFDATLWEHLCYGAGWTLVGVVGLSWCKGANLQSAAHRWCDIDPDLRADDLTLRIAGMINPLLLPETNSVKHIAQELEGDIAQVSVSLLAKFRSVELDVGPQDISKAPSALKGILEVLRASRI